MVGHIADVIVFPSPTDDIQDEVEIFVDVSNTTNLPPPPQRDTKGDLSGSAFTHHSAITKGEI